MRKRKKRQEPKKPRAFVLTQRQVAGIQNWESAFGLSPKETAIVENCGVSVVYERLARGEYDAIKDGTRTKITTSSIKQRRASLQRAEYKTPSARASHSAITQT